MLDSETKRRIDTARDILVGKVPDPKSQVEQITIALIYKFMNDMDAQAEEIGGKRRFFAGDFEKYGWSKLMAAGMGGHEVLNLYAEALTKMNEHVNIPPLFRDIFKNAYLPYRDPETLKSFLKVIDDFEYDHSERLGDAFEYLLSVLGSQGDAGQFRTPRHIIDFMVAVIDPKKNETILDPAVPQAGFLISAYKHILKENSSSYEKDKDPYAFELHGVKLEELTADTGKKYGGDKLTPDERNRLIHNICGYDISPDMVRLSLVNLYLHGFPDPHIYEYDTLTSEDRWNEYYDIIFANPPFMSPKGGIRPHKRFSVDSSRSEVLFVDYMAEHLTPNGRCAVVVPEGVIFQTGTAYKNLRKMLVDKNYLVGVISLPAGVFNPYSGVKTSILWLDRSLAKKTDKVLFVKIENDGFDLGAQRRPIKQNDLPQAFQQIAKYKEAILNGEQIEFEDNPNLILVEKNEIGKNGDFNLSGERYKKPSIRHTEFPLVELGEVCELLNGRAFKQEELLDSGKTPVLRVGNFFSNRDWYYSDLELEEDKYCNPGDLLYAWSASFGPRIWDGPRAIYHYHIWKIEIKTHKLLKEFLYQILLWETEKIESESHGGVMLHMTKKGMEQRKIPLPPLSVQEEIVAEIESYQKIIDGARQVVENYKPRIDIDPEWPMVELGDAPLQIIDGDRGVNYPKGDEFSAEGYCLFLNTKNVRPDGFNFEELMFITKEKDEKLRKGKLDRGDVILTTRGTVGNTAFYGEEVPFEHIRINSGMLIFRPETDKVQTKYLFYFFQSENVQQQFNSIISGSAQPQLPIKDLKFVKLPLPDLETQQQIVARIEREQELVKANKQLIEIFERKIKDRIAKVWGE